jgi:hypothetical protein
MGCSSWPSLAAHRNPDVPLSQGFENVATSLEGIPDSLLLLVWPGIVQFALIAQGWELVGRSRHKRSMEAPASSP